MQQTHTHKAVAGRIKVKMLLSRRKQPDYSHNNCRQHSDWTVLSQCSRAGGSCHLIGDWWNRFAVYCTLDQKLACFVFYLKIINLMKKYYMHHKEKCPQNSENSIKNLRTSGLIIKTYLKIKLSMEFWFSWKISLKMHTVYIFLKGDDSWVHKRCYFWSGGGGGTTPWTNISNIFFEIIWIL